MRDFASAKLHHCLHSIAFLQEPDGVIFLEVVIVIVGVGAELQLLHLYDMLFLLGFVRLLLHLVLVVAVIDRLRDRRYRGRGHYHQIETKLLRPSQSGGSRHDFCGSIGKYGPYFFGAYRFVNVFSSVGLAGREVAAWNHALCRLFTSIFRVYSLKIAKST